MNINDKDKLKNILEKYPLIRELIRAGDFDTLWDGLLDINFNEKLTGPGTAKIWDAFDACLFMTAFAEAGIKCKLKELPDFFAANPITRKSLFEIRIPDGVQVIGDSAFWDCKNLIDIYIPNSVKIIGDDAFELFKDKKSKKIKFPRRNILIPEKFKDDFKRIGITPEDNVTFI